MPWIKFHGQFGLRINLKECPDRTHDLTQRMRRQSGRRAATKLHMPYCALFPHKGHNTAHFLTQKVTVSQAPILMPHNGCIASAESAEFIAKRNMKIEGDRFILRQSFKPACNLLGTDRFRKAGCGRVTCIARQIPTVAGNQIRYGCRAHNIS